MTGDSRFAFYFGSAIRNPVGIGFITLLAGVILWA
jgi:hypothetical protein